MPLGNQAEVVINRIVSRLVERYHPERIVLYGSYAYGMPDDDSDIDLLIVGESNETPLARRIRVRRLVSDIDRDMPFSPLVLTPEELRRRLLVGDPFYEEILKRGTVLYARD
jgi:uncharacterized protein